MLLIQGKFVAVALVLLDHGRNFASAQGLVLGERASLAPEELFDEMFDEQIVLIVIG